MSTLNTTNLKNESSVTNNIVLGADGSVDFNGTVTATSFIGDGSGLTSLDAGDISAGTLAIARGGTNSTATPTQGGAAYGTGSAFAFTSAGSSGQVLTSNGTSAPTWQDAGGGAWNFISSVTANNSASVAFTSGIDSTYENYVIVASTVRPTIDNISLRMRVSNNGGSSYFSAGGSYSVWRDGYNLNQQLNNYDYLFIDTLRAANQNAAAQQGTNLVMTLFNPNSSSTGFSLAGYGNGGENTTVTMFGLTNNSIVGNVSVNAIQFYTSSSTIASGTFRLYGISNS